MVHEVPRYHWYNLWLQAYVEQASACPATSKHAARLALKLEIPSYLILPTFIPVRNCLHTSPLILLVNHQYLLRNTS
jgi:hypothetical protein